MMSIVNCAGGKLRLYSGFLTTILHITAGLLALTAKSKLIISKAYNGFHCAQNSSVLALLSNLIAKSFLTLFSSFLDPIN